MEGTLKRARRDMYAGALYLAVSAIWLVEETVRYVGQTRATNDLNDMLAKQNYQQGGPHKFYYDGYIGVAISQTVHDIFYIAPLFLFFFLLSIFLRRTITFSILAARAEE